MVSNDIRQAPNFLWCRIQIAFSKSSCLGSQAFKIAAAAALGEHPQADTGRTRPLIRSAPCAPTWAAIEGKVLLFRGPELLLHLRVADCRR